MRTSFLFKSTSARCLCPPNVCRCQMSVELGPHKSVLQTLKSSSWRSNCDASRRRPLFEHDAVRVLARCGSSRQWYQVLREALHVRRQRDMKTIDRQVVLDKVRGVPAGGHFLGAGEGLEEDADERGRHNDR